jgi:hypothetical protein
MGLGKIIPKGEMGEQHKVEKYLFKQEFGGTVEWSQAEKC